VEASVASVLCASRVAASSLFRAACSAAAAAAAAARYLSTEREEHLVVRVREASLI
jgi:hypothetical protein